MKTTRYIFSLLILSLATLTFQSCSDKDTAATATFINIYDSNKGVLETLQLPLSASHQMIGVGSDANIVWTAQCDADWCTISNHEGYGYGPDSLFYVRVDVAKNEGARRTANITFTSGGTTKTLSVTQKGSDMDPGDPFESAYKVVENIKVGYNLGNTLESDPYQAKSTWWSPKSDLDWETVWGQPKTTQAIIDSIASKGFNIIRVPVTWWPHMESDGTVREIWMNRVKEVVDMVLKDDCYCVINVMHDTGSRIYTDSKGTSELRTDSAGWLSADPSEYEASSVRYKQLWNQIATTFKDYDQHLLFESFNEILDGDASTWGDPSDEGCYTTINKLQQDFVDAVRATGGNNEYRNLVITTYSAGHDAAKLNGFEVPNDTHPNHLLASIHSYDPYNFCNDNSGTDASGISYDYNIYVWDSSCETEIDEMTQLINNRFNTLGIPYYYGEFGAIDEGKDMGERVKYAKYVAQKMKDYNTTGLWWMGLYNRRKKTWYETEIVDALFSVMGTSTAGSK